MPERDQEFVEVKIEEFASGKPVPYAIFIRLSSWKYLQIALPGDGLDVERLAMYKDKNVKALYLRKEDFASYVGFKPAQAIAPAVPAAPAAEPAKAGAAPAPKPAAAMDPTTARRVAELKSSAASTLELLRGNGLNEILFEASKEFVEGTVSLLADDHVALMLLSTLRSQPGTNAMNEHGLAVSLYSVMLGRVLGWKSSLGLFTVGLAGLLHDIGMNSLDDAVSSKPVNQLTPAELKLYEQHPEWGSEILKQLTSVPAGVVAVALQHHERENGTGYPSRLRGNSIQALAKVVAVADAFCELVLDGPHDVMAPRLDYGAAVAQLVASGGFAGDVLDALKRIVKGMNA